MPLLFWRSLATFAVSNDQRNWWPTSGSIPDNARAEVTSGSKSALALEGAVICVTCSFRELKQSCAWDAIRLWDNGDGDFWLEKDNGTPQLPLSPASCSCKYGISSWEIHPPPWKQTKASRSNCKNSP